MGGIMVRKIKTAWQPGVRNVLLRYSSPLVLACVLHYSLNAASVGYQGKLGLRVVSLGSIACQYHGIFYIPRAGPHQPGYAMYTSIWIWSEETCRSANTELGPLSLVY